MEQKSKYQLKMEEAIARSTPFKLTDEENFKVMQYLNKDMEDFIREEKRRNAASVIEAKDLIIGYNTAI